MKFYQKFKNKLKYENLFEYNSDISYKELYCKKLRGMSIPKEGSKTTNCSNYFALLTHKPKTYLELYAIIDTVSSFIGTVSKEKFLFVYGIQEGTLRWETYVNKQSETNSFEYKNLKYGISKAEFDIYNKSRAITKENCISRHGIEQGLLVWENYCERQSYTKTKEYAISIGKSQEEYENSNRKKGHNLSVYIGRYGSKELALVKLNEYFDKRRTPYSKQSQELFFSLVDNELFCGKTYFFAEYNKEYGVYDEEYCRYYKYDFVCIEENLVIEYHGDHYHGNPLVYSPTDYLKGRGCTSIRALEKWKYDDIKQNKIRDTRGFDVIVVWESDYLKNKENVIHRILNYVKYGRI